MPKKRSHRRGDSDHNRSDNAILRAIRDGKVDDLGLQLQQADDNGTTTDMRVALRAAVDRDQADIVRVVLKRASIEQINHAHPKSGETVLMAAKSKEIAELLIKDDADVNAVDTLGRTALMRATSKDIAEALINAGADFETAYGQARSALMHIVMDDKPSTSAARTEIAHLLIRKKADTEAVDGLGRTILMTAIWRNSISVVSTLLSKVNVNAIDSRGRNALHHLCEDRERAERMLRGLTNGDKEMIRLLIGSKIEVNRRDAFEEKTALHRAIANSNIYLARALLQHSEIKVHLRDYKGRTPLHVAAANGDDEILQLLLQKRANPQAAVASGGWTPLHSASAGPGKHHAKVVKTLLSHSVNATGQLKNGKSPVHLACEAGNLDVVKLLLQEPIVDIMARDKEGDTPLISAAKQGHANIVSHLWPLTSAKSRSEDAVKASKAFRATVIDFFPHSKAPSGHDKRSMHDLLYGKYPVSPSTRSEAPFDNAQNSQRFRWVHCPSNNITWCQELLLKRFAEQGGADAEGYKALERSFNYQHRGTRVHAHYMRPMCQHVPKSHVEDDGEASETDSVDSTNARSPSVQSHLSPPLDRHRSRSSNARPPETVTHKHHDRDSSNTTLHPDDGDPGDDGASNTVSTYGQPSRSREDNNMFLFAPYLHYETNENRKKMQRAIKRAVSREIGATPPIGQNTNTSPPAGQTALADDDPDTNLILAHVVDAATCSMNARRTLDQYYYRTIDTAKYRDHDQVVHRYQHKHLMQPINTENDIRLLMVDQLWMWIVGNDLLITSFPRRWQQTSNDPHDVLEAVISDVHSPGRAAPSSVYELALIIATRCFGPFDRRNISEGEMLFLDMFEASVGDVMDRETELFRSFKNASKEASRWLKVLNSPGKADYMYEQPLKPVRAPKLEQDQAPDPKGRRKTPGPKLTLVRTLLDIGEETRLMREIKDIRDELNMLRMIFQEQEKLLSGLRKTLLEMVKGLDGSRKLERSINRIYEDALPDIVHPLGDIDRMDTQADRIYTSVRDLLDLKQNYAISMQAADTARQGRTLMVFTVVTVIFLPLSFLTAFFALDIRDFPHGPNGNQDLPLSFVAKYVFGIGFVVAALSVLLALAWERLGLYIRRGRRKVWHYLHTKRHKQQTEEVVSSEPGVFRMQTWQSARSNATGRSSIEAPQATHQRASFTDVERDAG